MEDLRTTLSGVIHTLNEDIITAKPPVVQELILALRHVEDARMRLGVAKTYQLGNDPWTTKVKED